MKVGDYFKVVNKTHFAYGQTHCCTGIPHVKIKGYDDTLDFGKMIQFTITDYWDKPAKHVLPIEWCFTLQAKSALAVAMIALADSSTSLKDLEKEPDPEMRLSLLHLCANVETLKAAIALADAIP